MRKATRRRLEVESLESMTLLSGVAAEAHQAVEVLAKAVNVPNPLHLSGTLNGTFKAKANGIETITAKGRLAPFGKVSLTKNVPIAGLSGSLSNLAIPTKLGKLFVSVQVPSLGQSLVGTYTINGGTGRFTGETGSGVVQVTFLSARKFSATFS